MSSFLSTNPQEFMKWSWNQIEPYYQALNQRKITPANFGIWLTDWSRLAGLVYETYQRLYVAITVDTTDQEAKHRYDAFLDEVFANSEAAEQKLKEKLLESNLAMKGFEMPVRNLRAEAEIFCEDNLSWLAKELKLNSEYDRITGDQSVMWDGRETTISQLQPIYQEPDRQRRELAWRLAAQRQLADRQAINELWVELMDVRGRLAKNARLPDYRAFRWTQLLRFDYTPQDCAQFHQTIEKAAIPAAKYLYERRRRKLDLDSLRPWDLFVDPDGRMPLRPFDQVVELEERVSTIFKRVDPELGAYFEIMRREALLDLDNRKGKAPGGYCTDYPVSGRPFIFMNAVGIQEDVQTLIHEGGHAFHVFESDRLPYFQQKRVGLEFMEVASMGMELLAAPYLTRDQGGFYSPAEAARARIEFLEGAIFFWPYMAVVDAFQHWVYENHSAASDPAECDARWAELWGRFMAGEDWSDLDEEMVTGWQRKLHIIQDPFYYIEYGLAQLGALQIWQNARENQQGAVAAYRRALALGGTAPLPQLYAAAGVKFSFDAHTMQTVVDLCIQTIEELENQA